MWEEVENDFGQFVSKLVSWYFNLKKTALNHCQPLTASYCIGKQGIVGLQAVVWLRIISGVDWSSG